MPFPDTMTFPSSSPIQGSVQHTTSPVAAGVQGEPALASKKPSEKSSEMPSEESIIRNLQEIDRFLRYPSNSFGSEYGYMRPGTLPGNIGSRALMDHDRAENLIVELLKYQCRPDRDLARSNIQIKPSTYNSERIAYDYARELASDPSSPVYKARVQLIIAEREGLSQQKFSIDKRNDGKKFELSEDEKTVTKYDVEQSFRDEFRLARQAEERSQTFPGRTKEDYGRLGKYTISIDNAGETQVKNTQTQQNSPSQENKSKIEWQRPAIQYDQSAKLYDICLPDGSNVTVYLHKPSLIQKIKKANINISVEGLMHEPDSPGHTMLHAFNTTYADITAFADELQQAGISHVLTSPPLTWRADGPATPSEEKGQWYHVYQPEDLRVIENPHGNLQSYSEMITVLRARGIDVIADIPLNFMGKGGDGVQTFQYPSTDIRKARTESMRRGTGRVEGQVLIAGRDGEKDKLDRGTPDGVFTSGFDFESESRKIEQTDWQNPSTLCHLRLDGMLKIKGTDESADSYILSVQREYLRALKNLGVKGFRIDALKHMTENQFKKVFSLDITNNLYVFGETIVDGPDDPFWHRQNRWLKERPDIGAYDFPLQNKLLSAFSFGGDLRDLRMIPGYLPSDIPETQSVTFTVNHDIPNNDVFKGMLFSNATDEMLANAYILSIPGSRMPLIYSDGNAQKSVTSVTTEAGLVGKEAWAPLNKLSDKMKSMIDFHNKVYEQKYVWFAGEGAALDSKTCLAFSRGDKPVGEVDSEHSALVIINKADEVISSVKWPNKLKPGIYKDYGSGSQKEVFTVDKDGKLNEFNVGKRTALMLAWHSPLPTD